MNGSAARGTDVVVDTALVALVVAGDAGGGGVVRPTLDGGDVGVAASPDVQAPTTTVAPRARNARREIGVGPMPRSWPMRAGLARQLR
jgi:hypothetical protein